MKGSQLKFTEYEAPQKRIVVPPPTQFNGYLNNQSEPGSRPLEGLKPPPSNGLNVGKQLWTTDGYEKQRELQRAGGPEKPDYRNSDINRMNTFENKPSNLQSKPQQAKPVEEKKTKAARQLFEGITDKKEDDYDDYEVDEPETKQEVKQPEQTSSMHSLLELEAEGGLKPDEPPNNLLSIDPSAQSAVMEPQQIFPQPQTTQMPGVLGGLEGMGIPPSQGGLLGNPGIGPSAPIQAPDDPFGELTSMAGGNSLLGAPSQPTNLLDNQTGQQSAGFSFTAAPASSTPPSMSAASFQGYTLSTDQFGANWLGCPNEKKISILSMKVRDPQNFLGACVTINFKPIQIIGREAIAASLYKGVH